MKVYNLTLEQVRQVHDVCRRCPMWQASRIEGFNTCVRHHTDSAIFLVDLCADLGAILTPEREK